MFDLIFFFKQNKKTRSFFFFGVRVFLPFSKKERQREKNISLNKIDKQERSKKNQNYFKYKRERKNKRFWILMNQTVSKKKKKNGDSL